MLNQTTEAALEARIELALAGGVAVVVKVIECEPS